jgi:hypothetical protein
VSRAPARRAIVLFGIGVALMAVAVVVGTALTRPGDRTETGVVIAVDIASLGDVRGFTLRTTDGRSVDFGLGALENASQFPPSHLAEHRATSQPIVVTYREAAGERLAIRLTDAPGASP